MLSSLSLAKTALIAAEVFRRGGSGVSERLVSGVEGTGVGFLDGGEDFGGMARAIRARNLPYLRHIGSVLAWVGLVVVDGGEVVVEGEEVRWRGCRMFGSRGGGIC